MAYGYTSDCDCGLSSTVAHICGYQMGRVTSTPWPTQSPQRPCEHCWCEEQPSSGMSAKPHERCCQCFTVRLKAQAE